MGHTTSRKTTELAEVPLPPHLDRNEPLRVKHVSAKTGKKGGALGKKAVKDENEKAVVSVTTYIVCVCVL